MTYKVSKYNIVFENEDKELLMYNTLLGKKSLLKTIKYKKKIKQYLDEKVKIDINDELVKILIQFGYLVKSNVLEDEIIRKISEKNNHNKILNLIICPTGQCNMRCRYCCEDFLERSMKEEVRERLVQYIKNNISNYKEICINWFGGEPLLEKDIIYSLSDRIIKIAEENNVKYSAFMVTNGTLLDLKTFIELYKRHVYVYKITIDTTEKIHNQNRVYQNGKGSYGDIIKNLMEIKKSKQGRFAKIILYNNLSINSIKYLKKYKKKCYRLFGDDNRFRFSLFAVKNFKKSIEGTNTLTINQIARCYRILQQYKKYKIHFVFDEFINPSTLRCYAADENSLLISSTGKIYKCEREYQINRENNIGELDGLGNIKYNENMKKWNLKKTLCEKECKYKPLCLGEDCILDEIAKGSEWKCKCNLCHFDKGLLIETLKLLDTNTNDYQIVDNLI